MNQQQTIGTSCEITGIGIHSGEPVLMRLLPAPTDTGILFRRVDLPGSPEIPARMEMVAEQPRRTTLRRGVAEVNTCEHLLAAAWALGLSNLIVELDAAELPGCDGSAETFVQSIIGSGLSPQDARLQPFALDRPCAVLKSDRSIIALPYPDAFRVTYVYAPEDDAFGGSAVFDVVVNSRSFMQEVAPARTFVTMAEAKLARAAGLGLGATYDNTLVWDDGQVLNNRLRFPDEPARHKALDVIGDLALASRGLHAHVIAQRTGHRENLALLRQIQAIIQDRPEVPIV